MYTRTGFALSSSVAKDILLESDRGKLGARRTKVGGDAFFSVSYLSTPKLPPFSDFTLPGGSSVLYLACDHLKREKHWGQSKLHVRYLWQKTFHFSYTFKRLKFKRHLKDISNLDKPPTPVFTALKNCLSNSNFVCIENRRKKKAFCGKNAKYFNDKLSGTYVQ